MRVRGGDFLEAEEYFSPILGLNNEPFVEEAFAIEREAAISKHPFFHVAMKNRMALTFWAGQEAVVTNPFSQILFKVLANIKNVHIRTLLLPVAVGEHGVLQSGTARKSHPWLLWELCSSIGINLREVKISDPVADFIAVLDGAAHEPMRALGIIGVGNEMMLQGEYQAIGACFDVHFPSGSHHAFLQANIREDISHTQLIAQAASALGRMGHPTDEFVVGAREGVAARIAYYDSLLREIRAP